MKYTNQEEDFDREQSHWFPIEHARKPYLRYCKGIYVEIE